jgi:hypothetical protein
LDWPFHRRAYLIAFAVLLKQSVLHDGVLVLVHSPLLDCTKVFSRLTVNRSVNGLLLSSAILGSWCLTEKVGFCQVSFPSINTFVRDAKSPFETPESTLSYWVNSVNKQNWANEFECYTGFQQAKFTYHIVISVHDLRRDETLAKEANQIFLKYGFPTSELERFRGTRLDLGHLTDSEEIRRQHEAQLLALQERIQRWRQEIQTQNIRWKEMIEELQPLLVAHHEKYRTLDPLISSGLVFHLGYHRIEKASVVDVQQQAARGTALAVLRDPRGLIAPESDNSHPIGVREMFRSFWKFDGSWTESTTRRTRIEVQFVNEKGEWKIDSVPFR